MTIFRYPGGKSRQAKNIASYFPDDYNEYREPFVGGGSVFSNVHVSKERWINDLHPGLIEVYKQIKDDCNKFLEECNKLNANNLEVEFNKLKLNNDCNQAVRYFLVNRTCWGGRVNYDIPSRLYFSNESGWNILKTKKIQKFSDILKDVKITCTSYKELLTLDGDNVLIYLDPPYVVNTELTRTSQLYQHNFTIQDHYDLADILRQCKHKICLSYDNHSLIKKLYREFNIIELSWKYCGSSMEVKKEGMELLITNY